MIKKWKKYIEQLYDGEDVEENVYIEKAENVDINTREPYILKNEFQRSLMELSDRKATGVDKILAEVIKSLNKKINTSLFKYFD